MSAKVDTDGLGLTRAAGLRLRLVDVWRKTPGPAGFGTSIACMWEAAHEKRTTLAVPSCHRHETITPI